jgi:hypothetical protein
MCGGTAFGKPLIHGEFIGGAGPNGDAFVLIAHAAREEFKYGLRAACRHTTKRPRFPGDFRSISLAAW